jgi:hypothetical protein
MIKLFHNENINEFYLESESLLNQLILRKNIKLDNNLVHELFFINKELMKRPFISENKKISLNYNIVEAYNSFLHGLDIPLEEKKSNYVIDRESESWKTWESWCQEVVWYGNKRGAYMYDIKLNNEAIKSNVKISSNMRHSIEGHY